MDFEEMTFNQRIKHLRLLKNFNQRKMGEMLGIKTSTYSQKERNGNFTADDIKIICHTFDVDPYLLIFGKERPKAEKTIILKETSEKETNSLDEKFQKIANAGLKDIKFFQLILFLSQPNRDKVYKFALELYNKRKTPN